LSRSVAYPALRRSLLIRSIATRAPCDDSMRFEVAVLFLESAYTIDMMTIMTRAMTTSVTIVSTRVKPRSRRGGRVERECRSVLMSAPLVRDRVHRTVAVGVPVAG